MEHFVYQAGLIRIRRVLACIVQEGFLHGASCYPSHDQVFGRRDEILYGRAASSGEVVDGDPGCIRVVSRIPPGCMEQIGRRHSDARDESSAFQFAHGERVDVDSELLRSIAQPHRSVLQKLQELLILLRQHSAVLGAGEHQELRVLDHVLDIASVGRSACVLLRQRHDGPLDRRPSGRRDAQRYRTNRGKEELVPVHEDAAVASDPEGGDVRRHHSGASSGDACPFGLYPGAAVPQNAYVRGGSAHVYDHRVPHSRKGHGPYHAGGGSGEYRLDRLSQSGGVLHQGPVPLHHHQRASQPEIRHDGLHGFQKLSDRRYETGVHHGRGGPLIESQPRGQLVAEHHGHAEDPLGHPRGALLVRRVPDAHVPGYRQGVDAPLHLFESALYRTDVERDLLPPSHGESAVRIRVAVGLSLPAVLLADAQEPYAASLSLHHGVGG